MSTNEENTESTKKSKIGIIILTTIITGTLIVGGALFAVRNNKEKKKFINVEETANKISESVESIVIKETVTILSDIQLTALNNFIKEEDNTSNISNKPKKRSEDPANNIDDGSGFGKNNSKSDIANADKCIAILFNYGSSNESGTIFLRRFFGGETLPINDENLETAEILKVLDDFINEIPVEKRSTATFKLYGYTDTSFRNGIPDEGEESRIFNEQLSQKRAEFVQSILQEIFNISSNNISVVKGRGFENPWRDKMTEENKEIIKYNPEKSRRVEVFCYYEKD